MRRSTELTPLSHHHHVALEHALRLRRAQHDDLAAIVARFLAFFEQEGEPHLIREESALGPALAGDDDARGRLLAEHDDLRRRVAALGASPDRAAAAALGERLTAHIRFEERELFPMVEARLTPEQLAAVGRRLAA